jgi:hypothetical protein
LPWKVWKLSLPSRPSYPARSSSLRLQASANLAFGLPFDCRQLVRHDGSDESLERRVANCASDTGCRDFFDTPSHGSPAPLRQKRGFVTPLRLDSVEPLA